jgi:hypothetical protein
MASDNAKVRRWVGWTAALVVVIGVAGWFGYRAISQALQQAADRRRDVENLRMLRYQGALEDLDAIGDAGDETIRVRCRHAIQMLALLEPGWYGTYRSVRPASDWLPEPPAAKP